MTNPTSPESPWPVRTVAMKIAEWVARLGEVWVEGQVTQLNRRGTATAFLTLRDPAADVSVSVTCRGDVLDGIVLTDGARVVIRARPDYYVGRGTLTLSVPYRVAVNRKKSLLEQQTANAVNGGGFAKYLVFAAYSHRFAPQRTRGRPQ